MQQIFEYYDVVLTVIDLLDEDECAVGSPCTHSCNNIMGGFSCACPSGFTMSAESNTCQGQAYCILIKHPDNETLVHTFKGLVVIFPVIQHNWTQ